MKLYQTLESQLKKEPNYVSDNDEVKKWVVLNKAQNFDEELIGLLLDDSELKEKFFTNIKDVLIFNQNLFIQFLEQKNYLNDSYTQFKNKVGLSVDGKYLKQRNEVALVWPFKDCILEGGQSREEDKRDEIFFNETLAQDEITQLLDPKVLTNAKKFDKDGEKDFDQFNRNENGTITDNLIIKGNNLLALHSLKKEFAGKVKLIYIDPPYNTGGMGDTFTYNNNFKRSTWLTFMYNRLEAAKSLLSKDGVLIVAIDENEQPHLGVLLKDLFQDYEVHCITIVHNPRGVQGTNFSYTHEYAFFVFPAKQKLIQNRKIEEKDIDWRGLRDNGGESLRTDAKNCFYPIIVDKSTLEIIDFGSIVPENISINKRVIENENQLFIYPVDNEGIERKWRYARQSIDEVKNLLRCNKVKDTYDVKIGKDFGQYRTVWIDSRYDSNEYGKKMINSLVPNNPFSYPKSLWNVYDCIYAVVGKDKEAIILDYHAGSGTTAHAVLELNKRDGGNRKFILCEQMDYIETVTTKRIQKVIEQNHSDSFTYLELKKYNQTFIEKIEEAENSESLLQIWEEMKTKSFLNYNVDLKKQEEHFEDFKALNLNEQKQHLCELLNKNQLYVNLSSLNDENFECTPEEKQLTKEFYQLKN
ncbi:site-specific DNA-methyltransferase [Chryseobacterium elymi]|uniref:site-specific DNA-methyltransferase (adenine-specific) n=1 Tax=Chryseobacterium elymi TaxID=395936 RepID=A0A3D9DCB9_9FLAO|nr:site-specific DNA-methyltransferase [Chryseobacterium elymi]REC75609.1 site-specific DNA-methyltransferase [Chryseobacterium elymi]